MWWLLLLGLGILLVVFLTWNDIKNWFNQNKTPDKREIYKLVRENLDNGNCKIYAGIFRKKAIPIPILFKDKLLKQNVWEAEDLDEELKEKFGRKKEIIITYEELEG